MRRGVFVTGTDTGVGKTRVAEALLHALARAGERAVGMKPIATGCRATALGLRCADAERLSAASSVAIDYAQINPYAFAPAIAPYLAAIAAGVEIHLEQVAEHFKRLRARADWIVVEGVGGWWVPLNRTQTVADLAKLVGLPVILVVGMRLGCLNHAALTASALRADKVEFAGWVANQIEPGMESLEQNIVLLKERLPAPFLGELPYDRPGHSIDAARGILRTLGVAVAPS